MTLSASPTSIPADGVSSSAIRASVTDTSGTSMPQGTAVIFTTSLGQFSNGGTSQTVSTTDSSGSVTVSLISATTSGFAQVTATSGGVTQRTIVSFEPEDAPAVVGAMTLSASPTSMPADGVSSSAIRASVTDTSGTSMPQGTAVIFTTSLGQFSNGGTSQTVSTTDSSGSVTVSLISATTSGFAQVTATSGGVTQRTIVSFEPEDAPAVVGAMTLSASPTSMPADGVSSSAIRASVTDTSGTSMPQGTAVIFTTSLGQFSNGGTSQTVSTTDSSGSVTVSLISATTSGFAQVTATSGGVTQRTIVSFEAEDAPAVVGAMTLSASPTSMPADGVSSSAISASVTDTSGTSMPQGTAVIFTTSLGQFSNGGTSQTVSTTDSSGSVTVSLISATTSGFAQVTATSGGVTQRTIVSFEAEDVPAEVGSMTLSASSPSIPADGISSTAITVTVSDLENAPMPAGTPVTLTTTLGTFPGGIDPDGDGPIASRRIFSTIGANGQVTTSLVAPLSKVGTAVITATSGGVSQLLEIAVTVNGDDEVSLVALPTSIIADGLSTAIFTAAVKDGGGDPVAGVPVVFKNLTGQGLTTVETNTFEGTGRTDTTLFTHSGGALTLTMTHTDFSYYSVSLYHSSGQYITLLFSGSSGPVTEARTIEQALPAGEYYLDVYVDGNWTINLESELGGGVATPAFDESPTLVTLLTDAAGEAKYTYTSTKVAQAVTMGIKANDIVAVASIEQIAGSAASMSVYASPNPMHPGTQTTVTGRIVDSNNNPVSGESVNFALTANNSGGSLGVASAVTDLSGEASVVYTAGYTNLTTDRITVTSGTFSEIADILVDANAIVVGTVTLSADPATIPADGNSSAAITVKVLDINNAGMPSGTPIILTTSLGTFSNGETIQTITTTDGSGSVTVSLISTTTSGVAQVTATSGGVSQSLDVEFIGSGGTDEVAAIALVAAQTALNPDGATTITAMVYDKSGHGLSGQKIEFVLDDPTLGSITASGTTLADGTFVADFTAGSSTGTVNVTANSNSVSSVPLEITIKDQFVDSITVTVNPTSITVTKTASVSALVMDASATPVSNASVVFNLQDSAYGTITSTATTNAVGVATATFIAGNFPGTATIVAASGAVSDVVDLEIQPAEAASIEFASVSKNPIAVRGTGGQEFATIEFNVKDVNGNPGEDVDVLITMVSGMQGGEYLESDDGTPYEQVVGTSNGVASVTLHSGNEAGTVSITASIIIANSTTISATTPIISIGGGVVTDEWFVVSTSEPGWNLGGLACVGVETEITAWLADRFGNYNVLDGHTVSFQSEVGLAVNPIGVTDGGTGAATTTVRTQGVPKDVVPEIWEIGLIGQMEVDFPAGTAAGDPLPSGHPRDGVSNVLVFTIGEESFVDGSNGNLVNGVYDAGEDFFDTVDDPWRDYDDDGAWDDGNETTPLTAPGQADPSSGIVFNPEEDEYQDRNGNNLWDGKNNVWDGNKNLFRQVDFLITGLPNIRMDKASFNVANGGSDTVKIMVCDDNYNPLSAGSTYTVSVDAGKITGGATSHVYPSSSFYGSKTATDWDSSGGIDDTDYMLAHRSLIVNEITISDDDPAKDEAQSVSLSITVTWKSNGSCGDVERTFTIPGTVN